MTAKGTAKLGRVVAIQQMTLKLIGQTAAGSTQLRFGVMKFEDAVFLMMSTGKIRSQSIPAQ
jgi:hypothetical protein